MKPTTNSKPAPASKTVEQFLAELADADMTIADWARTHKQPLNTVYAVCGKRINGSRGAARKGEGAARAKAATDAKPDRSYPCLAQGAASGA